jgi:hypothetical protein
VPDRDASVQVFACNISTARFPHADEPEAKKATCFEQDITKPFPDEMFGSFGLISVNFMMHSLTTEG